MSRIFVFATYFLALFSVSQPVYGQPEDVNGKVLTVRGAIDPEELGVTLPHEHLLLFHGALSPQGAILDPSVVLDDLDAAEQELRGFLTHPVLDLDPRFSPFRGRTLVELSSRGLRFEKAPEVPSFLHFMSYPEALLRIALATGANIIMGSSYYKSSWHPPDMAGRTIERIVEEIVADISTGVDGTGIRAGIIGEVGIGSFDVNEQKVLIASALAQLRTGAPINLHFDTGYDPATRHRVLDLLERLGVPLDRVIVSHLLSSSDLNEQYEELARRNVYLEFDLFGIYPPEDGSSVAALSARGYADRLLVSQDIHAFPQLSRHGGPGYTSILDRLLANQLPGIAPYADTLMVANPRAVLPIRITHSAAAPELLRRWSGEDTARDSVTGATALPVNGAHFDEGVEGRGFRFPGQHDYVAVGEIPDLDPTRPFSVAFWMRAEPGQEGYRTILDHSHGGYPLVPGTIEVTQGWTFQLEPDGRLQFALGTGSEWRIARTAQSLRDGQWHRIAGVYTGSGLELYLDGGLVSAVEVPGVPVRGTGRLYSGAWGGMSRFFQGSIDEIELYRGALFR